jgi:thioredoxin-related protein
MKKVLHNALFLVITLFSVHALAAEAPRDPYSYFFNETFGDFSEELANAREQGKQGVMIFFEMEECPFCHWMKLNVLNQPAVQTYYREHFLLFPVDIEGDIEITDFAGKSMSQKDFAFKENRVRATPVIAFFDLNGKPVHRHTGRTSGVEEFMLMGKFVAEGHYKDMRFTRFKRENRK